MPTTSRTTSFPRWLFGSSAARDTTRRVQWVAPCSFAEFAITDTGFNVCYRGRSPTAL